jgi:hypothetical protein
VPWKRPFCPDRSRRHRLTISYNSRRLKTAHNHWKRLCPILLDRWRGASHGSSVGHHPDRLGDRLAPLQYLPFGRPVNGTLGNISCGSSCVQSRYSISAASSGFVKTALLRWSFTAGVFVGICSNSSRRCFRLSALPTKAARWRLAPRTARVLALWQPCDRGRVAAEQPYETLQFQAKAQADGGAGPQDRHRKWVTPAITAVKIWLPHFVNSTGLGVLGPRYGGFSFSPRLSHYSRHRIQRRLEARVILATSSGPRSCPREWCSSRLMAVLSGMGRRGYQRATAGTLI